MLDVSRQAFYDYLDKKDRPWKYQYVADDMQAILEDDIYNDTYGRFRMYDALKLRHENDSSFHVPGERTV